MGTLYLVRHGQLRLPDLVGVVLDVAGMRIILPKLTLGDAYDIAQVIEQDGARTTGALIQGQHVLRLMRGRGCHAFHPDVLN